jgi:conserved oligomeric Golgi complex subunit 8
MEGPVAARAVTARTVAADGAASGAGLDPEDDARDALLTLRGYILADVSPDAAGAVEAWPEFDSYVGDLCSHGLDALARQPDSLAAECARMRAQLEDVSCSNYRALIESFECAGAVRDGVGSIRAQLDQLVDALPLLAAATREFSSNAAEAQAEREARLGTLAEYGRVVDILEMPRLMRSLVAGELYEEALELHDMSLKFAAMHQGEVVLRSVCGEVDALTRQMVLQLISLLRGPVPLPTCLRVVGFLRRLAVFSEPRLRMLFLQCRGEWMRSSLETAAAPNAQARLVRLSDGTRAMMFEIVTQYRAAFADDEDGDDAATYRVGSSFAGDGAAADVPSAAILFDWTSSLVSQYLSRLEEGLRDVRDGASLSTVMQQAMYCGQSLGRVGADFRPALAPLFEDAILRIVNSHLNAALRQFEMMVEDHRWAPVGSSALRKDRMRGGVTSPVNSNGNGTIGGDGGESPRGASNDVSGGGGGDGDVDGLELFEPPMTVLDSPPLAVFLNGVLAALNELRPCAILSLSNQLAEGVSQTLLLAAECVSAVGGPGGAFLKPSDRPHFASMHSSLRDLCVPHVARCLDRCMDRRGLVDVDRVLDGMASIFGQSVAAGGATPPPMTLPGARTSQTTPPPSPPHAEPPVPAARVLAQPLSVDSDSPSMNGNGASE